MPVLDHEYRAFVPVDPGLLFNPLAHEFGQGEHAAVAFAVVEFQESAQPALNQAVNLVRVSRKEKGRVGNQGKAPESVEGRNMHLTGQRIIK